MEDFAAAYQAAKDRAEAKASTLANALMKAHREEDLIRASEDAGYREKLYQEFHL